MRSTSEIIVFALLMTAVLGLGHYYLWRRLVRDALLPKRAHQILTGLLLILLAVQPLTLVLMRALPPHALRPLAYLTFGWMGLMSTFFALLCLSDLGRQLGKLGQRIFPRPSSWAPSPDPARRRALGRLFAGGIALGGTSLGAVGVAQAQGFRIARIDIPLAKLPAAFDGFTILQMSDIHVGPTLGRPFVETLVNMANAERPDLVAITGDLVDGSVAHLARHTEPLRQLSAPYGTLFVTGNHEYYSGADEWIEELERLGIVVLRNDAKRIEAQGESFLLAGVTDYRADRYGDAPDLKRALRHRRPDEEVVLLAHQPRAFPEAAEHDIGLQLSGHTHGGQFWPWNWVIHLIEPVVSGWAQLKRTQIYVNSGTGYWGPPMRVGTRAEITVVTLRCSPEKRGAPERRSTS